MQEYVIIVAGGSGSRMKSELPKQFLMLREMTILEHTMTAFYSYNKEIEVVLVLPEKHLATWQEVVKSNDFKIKHSVVIGGSTRYQSVKNALASLDAEEGLVAVHDAVRPLVSEDIIRNSFLLAEKEGAAITAVSLKDSIREIKADGQSSSLSREDYRLVQTPQTFRVQVLKDAYDKVSNSQELTDDASVVERNNFEVSLVEGSFKNIKITTPEDLVIASAFMKK